MDTKTRLILLGLTPDDAARVVEAPPIDDVHAILRQYPHLCYAATDTGLYIAPRIKVPCHTDSFPDAVRKIGVAVY